MDSSVRAIEYSRGTIVLLDQTLLPRSERRLRIRDAARLAEAIESLRVRGAPALGIAGAMGVAQAAFRSKAKTARGVLADAERIGRMLAATRPTAVNLGGAIERVLAQGRRYVGAAPTVRTPRKDARTPRKDVDELRRVLEAEARLVACDEEAACLAMARNGQRFVRRGATVLTHCNTGMLATGGYGTAFGVIRLAHERGKGIRVLATETRPLLQGARLTAWELKRARIPYALLPDSAAASLMAAGEADVVLVGADRIAANGDTANKIGTYSLALAAREAGIPFVVVAPTSTVDSTLRSGAEIEVEQRASDEVTSVLGRLPVAPVGATARNPAFDVTPARMISAIVTERGVAVPPYRSALRRLVRAGRR